MIKIQWRLTLKTINFEQRNIKSSRKYKISISIFLVRHQNHSPYHRWSTTLEVFFSLWYQISFFFIAYSHSWFILKSPKKTFLLALLLWCYIERQWDIKLKKNLQTQKNSLPNRNIIARVSEWEKEGKINIYLLPSDEDKSL